jgi:hypothetical protein
VVHKHDRRVRCEREERAPELRLPPEFFAGRSGVAHHGTGTNNAAGNDNVAGESPRVFRRLD